MDYIINATNVIAMTNLPRTCYQQTNCNGTMKFARSVCVQQLLYLDLDALTAIAMRAVETPESQMESQMFL
jgi:hypothetical protein